jgi:hypothetical protein
LLGATATVSVFFLIKRIGPILSFFAPLSVLQYIDIPNLIAAHAFSVSQMLQLWEKIKQVALKKKHGRKGLVWASYCYRLVNRIEKVHGMS